MPRTQSEEFVSFEDPAELLKQTLLFRDKPGPLQDVYTELARRLGVLPSNVTHTTKPTLIN